MAVARLRNEIPSSQLATRSVPLEASTIRAFGIRALISERTFFAGIARAKEVSHAFLSGRREPDPRQSQARCGNRRTDGRRPGHVSCRCPGGTNAARADLG